MKPRGNVNSASLRQRQYHKVWSTRTVRTSRIYGKTTRSRSIPFKKDIGQTGTPTQSLFHDGILPSGSKPEHK